MREVSRERDKKTMITQQKDSPALQLVRLVFTEGQKATGHSWTRLNQALYQAAKVAIEGGLRFDLEDFTSFYAKMRAEYWIGAHPDGLYAAACKVGNLSACRAYEHHYGFCPYELDGQRVFVGHDFMWKGERVICTSIHKDHMCVVSQRKWTLRLSGWLLARPDSRRKRSRSNRG